MFLKQRLQSIRPGIRKPVEKKGSPSRQAPLILNEAINFEKRCIFIAIPKTGTTSVRTQIREQGVPIIRNPHLDIVQLRDSLYVYFLIQYLGKNEEFPTNTDKVYSDNDLRKKAQKTFSTFFKFSSVRNPWARAISLYFRREGVQIKDRIGFEDFCDQHFYSSDTCFHPTLHRNQTDWLCDESGNIVMDYVYKIENFDAAIKDIKKQTGGRIVLKKKMANKNPASHSQIYRNFHTEKTRKIIAKRFEKDIDTFKYTF